MLRLRFTSGLILGLVVGGLAGTLIGLLALPSRPADSSAPTSLQVQELQRRLEAAKEDKERVDRQLDQFTKLADQMTASFNSLAERFKALEEAQRLRDAHAGAPLAPAAAAVVAAAPTATVAPAPTGGEPVGEPAAPAAP